MSDLDKSPWRRSRELDLGYGCWQFEYRDDSYDPGDWCAMWISYNPTMTANMSTIRGKVRFFYDGHVLKDWPAIFDEEVDTLVDRYCGYHFSALEVLAMQSEAV